MRSKRHPSIAVSHPAVFLRDHMLPELGMSKTAFAKALGVSRQTLYDFLDEKQGVSASMALRLELVVGASAEHWLALQAAHDLWKARRELDLSNLRRLREATELEVAD